MAAKNERLFFSIKKSKTIHEGGGHFPLGPRETLETRVGGEGSKGRGAVTPGLESSQLILLVVSATKWSKIGVLDPIGCGWRGAGGPPEKAQL